jgi:hypothetical protein
MTQTYFPFDSGQGANATEAMWTKMAQHWLATGVIKSLLNELLVYADSTGMQVKVNSGSAWIKGHYYESDDIEIMAIGAADSVNSRIDRVILRLDWTANTMELAVLQGVAAVSPVAPALTQNSSRWEISLAQVRVNAGATTITAGSVTDERYFVKNANSQQESYVPLVLQNGWLNFGNGNYDASVMKDEFGFVDVKGFIKSGTAISGTVLSVLPDGYRPEYDVTCSLACYDGTNYVTAIIGVRSTGEIVLFGGANSFLSLSDIPRFKGV